MTQKFNYDSKRDAETNNRVGMAYRTGTPDPITRKKPAESLHIITAVKIAREYHDGEPTWVAEIELEPATAEQICAARKRDLAAERSDLLPLIASDGWDSKNPRTIEWIARFHAITAEIGE